MGESWDPENCPFNRSCTGWLGRKRPTMLTNALLLRDTVGNPLTRGTKLPPVGTTYGMILTDRSKTMRDALQGWGTIKVPDDHLTTNRKLLEKRQHRKKDWFIETEDLERPPTPVFNKNQVYGTRKLFYRETIDEILTNKFQKEFLEETKSGNKCYMEALKAKQKERRTRLKTNNIYENRACQLRKSAHFEKVEPKEPWRIKRFLEAEPHLSTFRSPRALEMASKDDVFESVGREGIWGHGITTKAKTLC